MHDGSLRKVAFTDARRIEVMAAAPLFAALPTAEVAALARNARLKAYSARHQFFASGDEGGDLYLVEHGAVVMDLAAPEGDKRVAAYWVGAGEVFGESEALASQGPRIRRLAATAAGDCAVITVPGGAVRLLAERFPALLRRLHELAVERQGRVLGVLADTAFIGLTEVRLARAVLERARLLGQRDGTVIRMPQRVTHLQLAQLIASDRRSVLEALGLWEQTGLVRMDRNGVLSIHDVRGLTAIAGIRPGNRKAWGREPWLEEIDGALAGGYNARARDLALAALQRSALRKDATLQHRAVLASARCGTTGQALELLQRFKLDHGHPDNDVAALEPRLTKDLCLASGQPEERRALALRSAEQYRAIFERTANYYPGINAATMSALGGDAATAAALARRVLVQLPRNCQGYWPTATRAEALLLLGETAQAAEDLARASQMADANPGAVATTRRQFRVLCAALGLELTAVLAASRQLRVVHYAGPPGLPANAALAALAAEVAAQRERHDVGWAFGGLACPADIQVAETLLAGGSRLHVVLPLPSSEVVALAVAPAGKNWVARYHDCLEQACQVTVLAELPGRDLAGLEPLAARLAMGLALRHARDLETEAIQLAEQAFPAGEAWRRAGGRLEPLRAAWPHRAAPMTSQLLSLVMCEASARGDAKGTQAIPDRLAARLASLADAEPAAVGRGLAWLAPDPLAAVRLAGRLAACKPGGGLELHLCCDVALAADAVTASTAARKRPQTPPSTAAATEAFVAEAMLQAPDRLVSHYAGRVDTAADGGSLPVFTVSERG